MTLCYGAFAGVLSKLFSVFVLRFKFFLRNSGITSKRWPPFLFLSVFSGVLQTSPGKIILCNDTTSCSIKVYDDDDDDDDDDVAFHCYPDHDKHSQFRRSALV